MVTLLVVNGDGSHVAGDPRAGVPGGGRHDLAADGALDAGRRLIRAGSLVRDGDVLTDGACRLAHGCTLAAGLAAGPRRCVPEHLPFRDSSTYA